MPISFVKKGLKEGQKPELTGGGFIHSLGGLSYSAVSKIKKRFLEDLLKDSSLKKKIDEMQQCLSNVKGRSLFINSRGTMPEWFNDLPIWCVY